MSDKIALRVALQTMKERCISLQSRLTVVEEENHKIREGATENGPASATHGSVENIQLRLKVAELERQKTQLSEHINMVSNENRKLWSRLSQMAKEQEKTISVVKDLDCTLTSVMAEAELSSPRTGSTGANQNLIRSKTFTQHSPNPHLRHNKIISSEDATGQIKDVSLDEVGLDVYADAGEAFAEPELGFAYLNVDESASSVDDSATEAEFNLEAKKCVEGLQEMRREVMLQQQDLNLALTMLQNRIALSPCSECAQKSKKPEMADKSLETDESLNEVKFYNNSQIMNETAINNGHNNAVPNLISTPQHLNIIHEKIQADAVDKTCPMCGKIYNSLFSFNTFREHVEMHFIDDSNEAASETSMDRNFEFISHAVGDF